MTDRIALKRLTQSDLTFIEYHFQEKTFGESRQKAINLNANVFVEQLFPDLLNRPLSRIDVLLTVYGPGGAGAFTPPVSNRPILNNNAKNWRLNGKTLPDDPAEPKRFHKLRAGDLAVFEFRGWPSPTEVDLIFLSSDDDTVAYGALNGFVAQAGRSSMTQLTRDILNVSLSSLNLPAGHPLAPIAEEDEAILEEVEEEIVRGRPVGGRLRNRRGGARLTPQQFEHARLKAAQIGADGENLVFSWLKFQENEGRISNVDWVAQRDAAAPYDFTFDENGTQVRMDAKSTNGGHERKFYLSAGEIFEAVRAGLGPYRIARISQIDDFGGSLKISQDIREMSAAIVHGLSSLPEGVEADAFSIDPHRLAFDAPIRIERPVPENT